MNDEKLDKAKEYLDTFKSFEDSYAEEYVLLIISSPKQRKKKAPKTNIVYQRL